MKYTIKGDLNLKFDVMADNVLPGRSYFVPFRDQKALDSCDIRNERYVSDLVTVLSGDWDFVYYSDRRDLPRYMDTDAIDFDRVAVPSVWQSTGYEPPCYINTRYQFKPNPPHIPESGPVGVYRKCFEVEAEDVNCDYVLSFLGVAGAAEVYFNGEYIGYNECSHNTAEYSLTGKVVEGVNELVVLNHKWSNGTYMEAQDMFRCNGIFRDVLLTKTRGVTLWDFQAKPVFNGDGTYDLVIEGTLNTYGWMMVKLYDGDTIIDNAESDGSFNPSVRLSKLQVEEWTAETPKLYSLVIGIADGEKITEIIRRPIGFKHIEIKGNVFTFNNKSIKLMGVNHHDTSCKNGYAMTVSEMERDVRLFKDYNVNCVRTSHYPPDPTFLDLCDEYGIYVVDEADIETHGCETEYHKAGVLSHNPDWQDRYWDRVHRMYQRDKNHPSITMWSLGNESHGYANQDYCYAQLKELTDIPIHYEGVCRTRRWAYDVVSQMYPWLNVVKKIADGKGLKKKYYTKPYFMCEYAHAMGLGAGELDKYVDYFLNADNMMGGCIWEFCDHAVYHQDGRWHYTYGGDHGEEKHDGNFCVDGLFDPERNPHPGAIAMRCCYRPVRAEHISGTAFSFTNINYFAPIQCKAVWTAYNGCDLVGRGEIELDIQPRSQQNFDIECLCSDVVFRYAGNDGKDLGGEQIQLSAGATVTSVFCDTAPVVTNSEQKLIISYADGRIVYNTRTGAIESYQKAGKEFINPAPMGNFVGFGTSIYRAPLDNDMNFDKLWRLLRLNTECNIFCKNIGKKPYTVQDNAVVISNVYSLVTAAGKKLARTRVTYSIYGDGTLKVDYKAIGSRNIPYIPRYGLTLEMPREYDRVTYFGRGDRANTSDFNAHAFLGEYSSSVADMHEDYIKPQESSMRTDVRWARVTNADGAGLEFLTAGEPFVFGADHYTSSQCAKTMHREDLYDCNTTVVHLDAYMMGCGSNSCGPVPGKEHKLNNIKGLGQTIIIKPLV